MDLTYYDNTRVSAYRECPRKFYLRHVKHFVGDGLSIDLIFGLAWHEAMNVLWPATHRGASKDAVIKESFQAFVKCWVGNALPIPTQDNYQIITERWNIKNPYIALEMLLNYYDQRHTFIKECSEVETERPFAVPLMKHNDKQIYLIGRLDKIINHPQQGRLVIEHKTTGWYAKEGGFRADYIESFSPNSQVDGYAFAGNSIYTDGVRGVWIDAALTHKTVHDKFKFIPIDRQFAALDAWLIDTRTWVTRIMQELEQHDRYTPDGEAPIPVFPKNTSSCHMFSGCSYRSVCRFIPNPATLEAAPAGFKIERWEPFDTLKISQIMNKEGD